MQSTSQKKLQPFIDIKSKERKRKSFLSIRTSQKNDIKLHFLKITPLSAVFYITRANISNIRTLRVTNSIPYFIIGSDS